MTDSHTEITWPAQLVVLHGEDREDLRGRIEWLRHWIGENPGAELAELAGWLAKHVGRGGQRLALIAFNWLLNASKAANTTLPRHISNNPTDSMLDVISLAQRQK